MSERPALAIAAPEAATPSRARARSLDHPAWPEVLALLEQAVPWDVACRLHGIVPETAEDALKHDEDAAEAVSVAKARGEILLLANGEAAKDPRWVMWRLERLYPKKYHLASKLEHTGKDGAPLAPVRTANVRADLVALQAEIAKALAEDAGK